MLARVGTASPGEEWVAICLVLLPQSRHMSPVARAVRQIGNAASIGWFPVHWMVIRDWPGVATSTLGSGVAPRAH